MADSTTYHTLESDVLGGAEAYDLLVGTIQPRPIVLVSTVGLDGTPNLAPFSFLMPGGTRPPSLAISVTLSENGGRKDTLRNLQEQGEFVVNGVTAEMVHAMTTTSDGRNRRGREWNLSGFEPLDSLRVLPKRVGGSPFQLECRRVAIVPHGDGAGSAVYVIGEIVCFHLRSDLGGNPTFDVGTLARLAGADYLDVASLRRITLNPTE